MAEVVVQGTLKSDGTLELSQPVNLPPGEVRVIVQALTSSPAGENALAVLEQIWAERRKVSMQGRNAAQIDADIQAMRDEWKDR